MSWAIGEKELRFYDDAGHVCANYLDEILPYIVDWFRRRLCAMVGNRTAHSRSRLPGDIAVDRLEAAGADWA